MKPNNHILMIFLLLPFAATAQDSLSYKNITALQPVPVKEHAITGTVEMNYLKHYIWRGMLFGSNDVAQPELNLKWKKFLFGLSSNINYKPSALPKEFYTKKVVYDEQDVEIGYATSYKKFDFECKAMAYFYINQINSPSTAELYNKTAFNINNKLSLFTENVIDIASYRGAYYNNTGVCYSTSLGNGFSAEGTLYASSGNRKFNNAYFESEDGGFNLIGGSIKATKDFGPFYLCFFAEINNYSNKGIKQATQLQKTDNYSFAVGWNF
jgi:hypothetical protein